MAGLRCPCGITAKDVHPSIQGRRSHRMIGGDIRLEVWGTEVPQRGPGAEPGRGSGGRSPPEAEAFFVKLHIIFALKCFCGWPTEMLVDGMRGNPVVRNSQEHWERCLAVCTRKSHSQRHSLSLGIWT